MDVDVHKTVLCNQLNLIDFYGSETYDEHNSKPNHPVQPVVADKPYICTYIASSVQTDTFSTDQADTLGDTPNVEGTDTHTAQKKVETEPDQSETYAKVLLKPPSPVSQDRNYQRPITSRITNRENRYRGSRFQRETSTNGGKDKLPSHARRNK